MKRVDGLTGFHGLSIRMALLMFAFFCCFPVKDSTAQVSGFSKNEHLGSSEKQNKTQEQLLSELTSARQTYTNHPSAETSLALGLALKALGAADAASKLFDQATEINPRLAQAWYEKGSIASEREDWSGAENFFRRALAISPDNIPAHLAMAEMLLRIGNFSEAANQCKSTLQLDPNSAGAHQGVGLIDLQEGKINEAVDEFRVVLRISPDYIPAKRALARALAEQHQWPEASALLKEVVVANLNSAEDTSALGTALANLGDKAEAARQFSRARELSSRELIRLRAEGEHNWGVALRNEGKLQDAAVAFRHALAESQDYCGAHDDLGEVLWLQKSFADALSEFRTAVRCGPDSASARNNLGSALLYYQHDIDSAIVQLREAINAHPGFALAHFNLGKALAAKQDLANAEPQFRAAIAIDPTLAAAHLNLGIILAMRGRVLSAEARDEMQNGLRLDPRLRDTVPQQYLADLR